MSWLRPLIALPLAACLNYSVGTEPPEDPMPESTTDWLPGTTLHNGDTLQGRAAAGTQHGHSIWVAASNMNHVPLVISAHAGYHQDVRIVVLGPSTDDLRPLVAADGFAERKPAAEVTLDLAAPGEYLVLVGSHGLERDTSYELTASCTGPGCGVSRIDALATPKAGALIGTRRHVEMLLGDMLVGQDVTVELWASPPMQWWNGGRVAVATGDGAAFDAAVPASVRTGDDLLLVVRDSTGRVLDTGVRTRFAAHANPFARVDRVMYGEQGSMLIAGAVGYFEAQADLRVRSETRDAELAHSIVNATMPGQPSNGLGAFDAAFVPDASVTAAPGELLSIGYINGNGEYRRLACFEYGGGAHACP